MSTLPSCAYVWMAAVVSNSLSLSMSLECENARGGFLTDALAAPCRACSHGDFNGNGVLDRLQNAFEHRARGTLKNVPTIRLERMLLPTCFEHGLVSAHGDRSGSRRFPLSVLASILGVGRMSETTVSGGLLVPRSAKSQSDVGSSWHEVKIGLPSRS